MPLLDRAPSAWWPPAGSEQAPCAMMCTPLPSVRFTEVPSTARALAAQVDGNTSTAAVVSVGRHFRRVIRIGAETPWLVKLTAP